LRLMPKAAPSAGARPLVPRCLHRRRCSVVVVRASDSRLIGFDASDGTQRWIYQRTLPALSLRSTSGMLAEDGVVIVGYPGGKLVALNTDNGGPLWELTVATPRGVTELERIADIAGTAVLGRREVCAVAYQGRAACFDLENGNALWSREFSSSVGMDRDTRFAFITDASDAVHGLDAFSGSNVWKQDAMTRRGVSRPRRGRLRAPAGSRERPVRSARACRQQRDRCRSEARSRLAKICRTNAGWQRLSVRSSIGITHL